MKNNTSNAINRVHHKPIRSLPIFPAHVKDQTPHDKGLVLASCHLLCFLQQGTQKRYVFLQWQQQFLRECYFPLYSCFKCYSTVSKQSCIPPSPMNYPAFPLSPVNYITPILNYDLTCLAYLNHQQTLSALPAPPPNACTISTIQFNSLQRQKIHFSTL